MNKMRMTGYIAAALVAGLVVGNVISGWAAAPAQSATASAGVAAACAGAGMRLGASLKSAGGRLVDVVAELTGQDTEEVLAQRADGKSFEQIAAAEGVSADKVVDEALAVRKQLLADKVAAGEITQAQADAALANMETRLTERVSTTGQFGGGRGGCGMGGGGRGGAGGCGMSGAGSCAGAGSAAAGCGGSCGGSATVSQ
jgi:hypothetical protein